MLFFFPQYKGLFYQLEELWYSKTLQTDKAEYWNTGTGNNRICIRNCDQERLHKCSVQPREDEE